METNGYSIVYVLISLPGLLFNLQVFQLYMEASAQSVGKIKAK